MRKFTLADYWERRFLPAEITTAAASTRRRMEQGAAVTAASARAAHERSPEVHGNRERNYDRFLLLVATLMIKTSTLESLFNLDFSVYVPTPPCLFPHTV